MLIREIWYDNMSLQKLTAYVKISKDSKFVQALKS